MKEKTVKKETSTVDGLELTFTLTRIDLEPRSVFGAAYSIGVELKDRATGKRERCVVADVSRNRSEAERLFRLAADGAVTPTTLPDVISDLLAEY
ncbi:MAG: hypothetical protein IJS45_01170 [Clostridia bacterium]|nr:hypothetical protein [Clostridia bacterium]